MKCIYILVEMCSAAEIKLYLGLIWGLIWKEIAAFVKNVPENQFTQVDDS